MKKDAAVVQRQLAGRDIFFSVKDHKPITNVYGRRVMTYIQEPNDHGDYRFMPSLQFEVERLLVDHWTVVDAMLVECEAGRGVDCVEGVEEVDRDVLPLFRELLGCVEPNMPCASSWDFCAAVRHLLGTREFSLLREHVVGPPAASPWGWPSIPRSGSSPFMGRY